MNSTSISALFTVFLLSAAGANITSIQAAEKQDIPTAEEFLNDAGACEKIAYEQDRHLAEKAAAMQVAIDKFKNMGVGVSLFEQSLQHARILIAEGKSAEANEALGRLNHSLTDQQKRFYADKIQSWHSDRARMIADRIAMRNGQTPANSAGDLSRAAHRTLSKKSISGSPMIYPIGR